MNIIPLNANTLSNASYNMNVLDDIATNPRLAAMLQDMQNNVYQPNTYMSQPIMNTQAMTGASDIGGYKAPLSTDLGTKSNYKPMGYTDMDMAVADMQDRNRLNPMQEKRVNVDATPNWIESLTKSDFELRYPQGVDENRSGRITPTIRDIEKGEQFMTQSEKKELEKAQIAGQTQAQTQAKAQQQAMPTQPQIKQAIEEKKRELSLLELFGKGMADALKDPVTSTGKTNTLYDMLRGAMAVQAPQQSAIMEQEIKGLQDTETARVKAEAELEKQTLDLQGKILLEQAKKGSARDANYYFGKSNSQVLYTTPTPEQLVDPRLKSRIIETNDGQKVIQLKQINANDPNVQKLHLWNNMMKIQDSAVDKLYEFGLTPDMILTKSPFITQLAKSPAFKTWHAELGRAFQEYRTAKTGAQASDKEIERLKHLMPTGEEADIESFLKNLIQIQKEASVSNKAILDGFQALGYDVNGLSTMLYQPRTLAQTQLEESLVVPELVNLFKGGK